MKELSVMRIIEENEAVFSGLIGQLAWGVRRGHGSFLTIEFGAPRLSIREPKQASVTASSRVRQLLARRPVSVIGAWHLWIMHGHWTLTTLGAAISSDETEVTKIDPVLAELDGQRLTSAHYKPEIGQLTLVFDLGCQLEVGLPAQAEAEEDQWQLFEENGDAIISRYDGRLLRERRDLIS